MVRLRIEVRKDCPKEIRLGSKGRSLTIYQDGGWEGVFNKTPYPIATHNIPDTLDPIAMFEEFCRTDDNLKLGFCERIGTGSYDRLGGGNDYRVINYGSYDPKFSVDPNHGRRTVFVEVPDKENFTRGFNNYLKKLGLKIIE